MRRLAAKPFGMVNEMWTKLTLAAAMSVAALTAEAATMKATWTGTVSSSYVEGGDFGAAGSELDGQSFVLTYVFDTDFGARYTVPGGLDYVYGGNYYYYYYDQPSPVLSTTLTIGGQAREVLQGSSGDYGYVHVNDDSYYGYDQYYVQSSYSASEPDGSYESSYVYSYVYQYAEFIGADNLEQEFSLDSFGGAYFYGYFSLYRYDATTGAYSSSYGYLTPETLTVSVAAVPLPASGLALVAALGGLVVIRRRRKLA